ncbi:uncharacterized protein LOC113237936 [Hyposmocoma kahamanoa]|uniref:uncharacterized protein LOC113237936 n=1 Tax=Hyposmocoma kahamanoa TaxID=1477025 RepID=UPI000E6D81F5|nr:uncharacterized protein LOC113237936 [Hyposmocoma kahamanoa]
MVEFQFVGDINDLSVEQKDFITNVLKKRGFENGKIQVQPVGKAGDNYAANVKRITIESNGETFKIIAKVASKQDMMRAMGNTTFIYQNEHVMYTEVLPTFTELENAAKVPGNERFRYAACYGTYLEAPNEIILLEDLGVLGFQILDRFTSLTDENVRLVLKNFASLHSLSYVLKNKEPEKFETFKNKLVDFSLLMASIPESANFFSQIYEDVQKLLRGDKYKKAVKNVITQMITYATKLAKIEHDSKFSVIQQGDAWTNNIMFRLENDKTVECCMIDYQASKVSSPVADLHYMIFLCTDYATRKKHYDDWINYYHSQLDKNLSNYGLKANYVYPRDKLDADLRRFAKASIGQIIFVTMVIIRESANAAKLQDAMKKVDSNTSMHKMADHIKLSGVDPETIKKFQSKIEGVIDSFIELGYL